MFCGILLKEQIGKSLLKLDFVTANYDRSQVPSIRDICPCQATSLEEVIFISKEEVIFVS